MDIVQLQSLDYIAVLIYLVLMAVIGLSFGWFVKDIGSYFKGGGTIPWVMATITNFMGLFSTFVFVAYAGIAYEYGLVSITVFWTTVPAFIAAGVVYTFMGSSVTAEQGASLDNLSVILSGLEKSFNLGPVTFIPPVLMIVLAYRRYPVLPVMLVCLLSAMIIAVIEGVPFNNLATMLTSGYVSKTGIAQLDPLLSRGGLMSIMPTVLLLCSGMAFGGILERSRVLEVLLEAILKGAKSAVRLVASALAAAYLINFGTGSQMLAVIVPGRAFLDSFKKADISPLVLSRTCEDAGTIGCPLVPWSVHAFYIAGVLGVSAYEFVPYALLNWFVPIFSLLCAATLRHWETMFETIAPRKNKKGDRMYNAQDVEAVRLVHFLVKESGYTLAGAVEHIRTNKKALTRRMEALRILRGVRSELEKLKNSL